MNNKKIVITGANGFIGENLINHLLNIEFDIVALVHKLPNKKIEGVSYYLFNLEDEIDEKIFNNTYILIHCAFVRFDKNINANDINYYGTERLLNLCNKLNIRAIYLSSFSAHNDALSNYGKIKLKCEKLFDLHKHVVLKPGLVIGEKGLAFEIITKIKSAFFFPLIGAGNQSLQTIYIQDLCIIIEKIILNNITGIFYVAEPDPINMKMFYLEISRLLKKKIIFIRIPIGLLLYTVIFLEKCKIKLPVSSENILGLKKLKSFNTQKDLSTLGVSIKNYKQSLLLIIK